MKRLVVDLDGTLTVDDADLSYADKQPNLALIAKLHEYAADGFVIIVQTARNMRTHNNSVGKITAHTLPVVIDCLRQHDVPYDEIHVASRGAARRAFTLMTGRSGPTSLSGCRSSRSMH